MNIEASVCNTCNVYPDWSDQKVIAQNHQENILIPALLTAFYRNTHVMIDMPVALICKVFCCSINLF